MDGDVVLRADGLGKSYTRYASRWAMLRDRLAGTTRRGEPHWALRGVSFEVRRGEAFGVIGRNGAGKSTLLQLLAGVMQPTEGHLEVQGKVLALLELGASFDPESTGRDNARVQMALFGIPSDHVAAKLEEVAAFADIGPAFDEPVKSYSSGMFVRLAFAVNTVLEPDILLVDEALAVGDVFFQQKCFERLAALRRRGTSILLVSHNMMDIERFCTRAMLLDEGRLVEVADPYRVVHRYLAPRTDGGPAGSYTGATLESMELLDDAGRPTRRVPQGETLHVEARFRLAADAPALVAGIEVDDAQGVRVHARHSLHFAGRPAGPARAGQEVRVRHTVRLPVAAGAYTLALGLASADAEAVEGRRTIHPDHLGDRLRMLCRSRKVAFEIALPPDGDPARQPFLGLVQLESTQEVRLGP